jgi:hypothetical protein
MVKNTKGGKHKAGARKHMTAVRDKRTRLADPNEEGEKYAYVSTISGGSNCRVICQDGHERICVIRGKFRGGRGKRNNFVGRGTWLLVGIREWSSGADRNDGKLDTCDLLEVYADSDKQELLKTPGDHWKQFIANDNLAPGAGSSTTEDDMFVFTDNKEAEEYEKIMSSITKDTKKMDIVTAESSDEEDVDIDDI